MEVSESCASGVSRGARLATAYPASSPGFFVESSAATPSSPSSKRCEPPAEDAGCWADWMAKLPNHLPIAHVSLPGTHNSASYGISKAHLTAVMKASRCQKRDLNSQLCMGVRFLDLRVRPCGLVCHGPVSCGLTLRDAFDICGAFLRKHPSEVILTRVKDEGASKTSARGVDELVQSLAESAEYPLYLQMRLPTMGEVRGRMVLLCDWEGGQLGLRWGGDSMRIQDEYWHRNSLNKWSAIQRALLAVPGPTADNLHIHFTSATNLPRYAPVTIARGVNPQLSYFLRTIFWSRFLGVIVMDFPSPPLCELILHRNWADLDPCRAARSLSSPSVHDRLDDLTCEFLAAASRADGEALQVLGRLEELPARLRCLAQALLKLAGERCYAELCEPALEDVFRRSNSSASFSSPACPPSSSSPTSASAGCGAKKGSRGGPGSGPRRSLLRRFGSCLSARRKSPSLPRGYLADEVDQADTLGDPEDLLQHHRVCPPPPKEFLENLECELLAAATRADALSLDLLHAGIPLEQDDTTSLSQCAALPGRVCLELETAAKWLATVFIRLLVGRCQADIYSSVHGGESFKCLSLRDFLSNIDEASVNTGDESDCPAAGALSGYGSEPAGGPLMSESESGGERGPMSEPEAPSPVKMGISSSTPEAAVKPMRSWWRRGLSVI